MSPDEGVVEVADRPDVEGEGEFNRSCGKSSPSAAGKDGMPGSEVVVVGFFQDGPRPARYSSCVRLAVPINRAAARTSCR